MSRSRSAAMKVHVDNTQLAAYPLVVHYSELRFGKLFEFYKHESASKIVSPKATETILVVLVRI